MNTTPTIIFEDDFIIVFNKPAGLVVDALQKRYPTFHLVHRLDRETSGVIVMAKTTSTFEHIKKQFQKREVRKTYRAFVYGKLAARGIVDKPIGSARGGLGPRSARKPYGRLREATTVYKSVAYGAGATYAEIFPKTGRTHQIRVHLASIGHPVIADSQYAAGRPPLLGFARLALHALSLALTHPITKKEVTFEAPLPEDFKQAEQKIFAKE